MTEGDIINFLAEYGIFDVGFINNTAPVDVVFEIDIQDFKARSLDFIINKISLSSEDTINMLSINYLQKDTYSFRFESQKLYYIDNKNPSKTEYEFLSFLQTVFRAINGDIHTKF